VWAREWATSPCAAQVVSAAAGSTAKHAAAAKSNTAAAGETSAVAPAVAGVGNSPAVHGKRVLCRGLRSMCCISILHVSLAKGHQMLTPKNPGTGINDSAAVTRLTLLLQNILWIF